jgi:hypothetical protein
MKKKFTKILGVALTLALLTSLLVASAPALATIGQPTVTLSSAGDNDEISKVNPTYVIRFRINEEIAPTDDITITFPEDTGVTDGAWATGISVAATTGWIGGHYMSANTTNISWVGDEDDLTLIGTLGTNDGVGEGAEIRIEITAGLTNPSAAGTYTLEVETSEETTGVESTSYTIVEPTISPLPGIVSLYNSAGVLMDQETGPNALNNMIAAATPDFIVELGPGTYDEDPDFLGTQEDITIRSSGAVEETIVEGDWTIDDQDITIDSLTLKGTLTVSADDITIKNCAISKQSSLSAETLIDINSAASANDVKVQDCTIDLTRGTKADTGIDVADGDIAISGCTFTLDDDDVAVNTSVAAEVDITGCSISGSGDDMIGYNTAVASEDTIEGNTFDGLRKAVVANGTANMTIEDNVMMNGTKATGATSGSAKAQIYIMSTHVAADVLIQGNEIKDGAAYSVQVELNADRVTVIGNQFGGNAYGLENEDPANELNAVLNYWGSDTGPTHDDNLGGTGDDVSDDVLYTPWAAATVPDIATANLAAAGTVDRSTTVGIRFTSSGAAGGVTLARYSGNPQISDPMYSALSDGYYDVYAPDIGPGTGESQTILFYNAGIDQDTVAYYFDTLEQDWVECSDQGVAGNNAYVIVTVTDETQPTNDQLGGTVFVLVTVPPSPEVELVAPTIGAYDVPIDPTFTWKEAAGVIRYEIAVAEDPTFAIIDWSYNVEAPYYKTVEALDYSTTYYWRVRGLTGEPYQVGRSWITPAGPWSTGVFTTKAEPVVVEEEPEQVEPPQVDVEVKPADITVKTEAAVPSTILWTIVGIGAVLIIALIVLIVRTRRVA